MLSGGAEPPDPRRQKFTHPAGMRRRGGGKARISDFRLERARA